MNLIIKNLDELKKYKEHWIKMEHKHDILPFLTYEWIETWIKYFGKNKKLKIIMSVENDEINYVVPLIKNGLRYRFIGYNNSDYLDAVVIKGFNADELFKSLPNHMLYDFEHIFNESVLFKGINQLDKVILNQDTCPYIELIGDFDYYMSGLNKRFKKNYEYSLRRINRDFKVEFLKPRTNEDIENFMDALIMFHQKRWRKRFMPGAFYSKKIKEFHKEAAKKLLDSGNLLLNALILDGNIAGVIYGFKNKSTYFYYLSGFDEKYSYLSVGNIMVGLTIKEAFENGAKIFDFLRGSEKYKYLWTQKDKILKRVIYYNKSIISKINAKILELDNEVIMNIKEKSEE